MNNFLGYSDGAVRFAVFLGVLLLMALVEVLWPKRKLGVTKGGRWVTNLSIGMLGALLLRLMAMLAVPIAAVAAAFYAERNGLGLLNQVALPGWFKLAIALLVLDLAIWAQHLVSHKVPIFWRLHQVHHADRDIDVTTAIRFHPIEIGLSMLWKIVVVLAIGASPLAVFLFEVILNACAMFNHANIALPLWLDRYLRVFIVTPDMHRVHHSVLRREHDSNYGFNLSVWDRLFRTYTAQPEAGHQGMTIGLPPYQNLNPTRFDWSLLLPFRPLKRSSSGSSGGKAPRSGRTRAPARGRNPKSR
ncbi:MAG TPA: sterol desaturase family protein [Methyloceanibacter sp.]|jgi:sterol desaturase/sphingolipid hydroxylase (fatty acid hydroxylase superfamily)